MSTWKNRKILPMTASLAIVGFTSFAYQNCARARFSIDPIAKSEALGKENVFGNQPGDDGSIIGRQPGNDGGMPGGGAAPGDDSSMPGKNPPGNDPSIPGKNPPGNDPSIPGKNPPGNDPSIPGMPNIPGMPRVPGNDPGIPKQNPPGNDPGIPGKKPPVSPPSVPKNPPGSTPGLTSIPVGFGFYCSNLRTEFRGGNLLSAEAVKIVILDKSNNKIACELNGDFKSQILNTKKVTFTPCAGLAAGKYSAVIMDTKVDSSSYLEKHLDITSIQFLVNEDKTYTLLTDKIDILYDLNNADPRYNSDNGQYGDHSTDETQKNCDKRVSPLIISMNSEARGIKLSAPLDGIQFDILGENSFPMAHDKKQISWLTADDQEYYYIVRPRKDGKVLGIDEMFGDNTKGPDGKFSDNGYEALAKYDTDKDGLITDEDDVYSDLRLWNDRNRDGVADPNELYKLEEKNVTVIDLHYDNRYKETDQYGNQTLMKSVVKTKDGKLHLLFDLWFRYLNITK
jgi:hypothetical protein